MNVKWTELRKKLFFFFVLIVLHKKDGMIYMGSIKYYLTLCKERVSYTTAQKLKIIKYIEMNVNRAECLKALMFADLSQNNSKKNYLIEELLSNSLIIVTL